MIRHLLKKTYFFTINYSTNKVIQLCILGLGFGIAYCRYNHPLRLSLRYTKFRRDDQTAEISFGISKISIYFFFNNNNKDE